jgi:putative ABC transport system substrate-binding protein
MKHMLRFGFVVSLVLTCLLLASCSGAPKTKNYTIGIINPSANQESTVKGFKEGLADLGYVEGKNVTYIYTGPVDTGKIDAVAQDLVEAKVNLILSITTSATLAAKQATAGTDIPVVFIPVTDPVAAGVVDNLMKPGGNITGITSTTPEGKRLEWLLQVAPKIKFIYIVYNPDDQSSVQALKTVSETAVQLGVELITRDVATPEEAKLAFTNIPKEANAIFLLPDYLTNANNAYTLQRAIELGLPTSGPNTQIVDDGALTGYGVDLTIAAREQAARLASQILQGVSPADLPVETAELYSAINLITAKAINLDISDAILRQTNIIIR